MVSGMGHISLGRICLHSLVQRLCYWNSRGVTKCLPQSITAIVGLGYRCCTPMHLSSAYRTKYQYFRISLHSDPLGPQQQHWLICCMRLLCSYRIIHMFTWYHWTSAKAFDTVRHHTLVMKLADLPLPACIHNWFVEWLTNRKHCTKFQDKVSPTIVINASIIQGSGLGPVAFIIDASDLHAGHAGNKFCKYADDMYILVPSCNSHTIPLEMEHIQDWADANNLKLNVAKSTEMILRRPGARAQELPPNPLPGIQRVETLKYWASLCQNFFHLNPTLIKLSLRQLSPCTPSVFSELTACTEIPCVTSPVPRLWLNLYMIRRRGGVISLMQANWGYKKLFKNW